MQRRSSMDGMRLARLKVMVESFKTRENAAHSHDRVTAIDRPATMSRNALGRDLDPLETFVTDGNRHICRFADDRRIRFVLRDQSLGANAAILLIDDCGN